MTGFGVATAEYEAFSVTVEVRTVNSKSQDFSVRLPRAFGVREQEIKNLMAEKLERGKVSVSIDYTGKAVTKAKARVNRELVKMYCDDIIQSAQYAEVQPGDVFRTALTMPEAITYEQDEKDEEGDWKKIHAVAVAALEDCDKFRQTEGAKLKEKLTEYIDTIRKNLEEIIRRDPERFETMRKRLESRILEYVAPDQMDRNRFEQEVIYYIEKLDITEEKVRLETHLNHFTDSMNAGEGVGKKLGFIAQEIGREINTIGSKANDAGIQQLVVSMKDELEKIKEQSFNVL